MRQRNFAFFSLPARIVCNFLKLPPKSGFGGEKREKQNLILPRSCILNLKAHYSHKIARSMQVLVFRVFLGNFCKLERMNFLLNFPENPEFTTINNICHNFQMLLIKIFFQNKRRGNFAQKKEKESYLDIPGN